MATHGPCLASVTSPMYWLAQAEVSCRERPPEARPSSGLEAREGQRAWGWRLVTGLCMLLLSRRPPASVRRLWVGS